VLRRRVRLSCAITSPLQSWRADVERHLDVAQFMRHVAIENCLAENDGILGHAGMNNFYLYRESSSKSRSCDSNENSAIQMIL
jgi:spore coat protein CotH